MKIEAFAEIKCAMCNKKFLQIHNNLNGVRKIAKNCGWSRSKAIDGKFLDICNICNKSDD